MLCHCDTPAGQGDPHGEPFQSGQEHTATVDQVLLLTLTGTDPARNERELAELEGLARSAVQEQLPSAASVRDLSLIHISEPTRPY